MYFSSETKVVIGNKIFYLKQNTLSEFFLVHFVSRTILSKSKFYNNHDQQHNDDIIIYCKLLWIIQRSLRIVSCYHCILCLFRYTSILLSIITNYMSIYILDSKNLLDCWYATISLTI